MIEHGSQGLELRPTPHLIRTMVNLLHVRRALQMTIQVAHSSELAAAKVALVCVAVPGVINRPRFGPFMPFQEIVRDDTVSIALS